jgi:hypothetical protein
MVDEEIEIAGAVEVQPIAIVPAVELVKDSA